MEFNEKLQELRKSRGLTQEELAEALFVSRTAVSKWESGRGYPNIDSLKELAIFFSVSIDELIRSDEILSAAENDKKEYMNRTTSFICGMLDIVPVLLLFIPVFGNVMEPAGTVSLVGMTNAAPWIKPVFMVLIMITVLNGICGVIISHLGRPLWNKHRIITGLALSIISSAVFIVTRQPYAGIICFIILVIKGILLVRAK